MSFCRSQDTRQQVLCVWKSHYSFELATVWYSTESTTPFSFFHYIFCCFNVFLQLFCIYLFHCCWSQVCNKSHCYCHWPGYNRTSSVSPSRVEHKSLSSYDDPCNLVHLIVHVLHFPARISQDIIGYRYLEQMTFSNLSLKTIHRHTWYTTNAVFLNIFSLQYCWTWPSWPTVPVFPGQSRFGILCPRIPNVVSGTPKCPGLASEVPGWTERNPSN